MQNNLCLLLLLAIAGACTNKSDPSPTATQTIYFPPSNMVSEVPFVTQRQGDTSKGWNYLVNGDYLNSGIPLSVYQKLGLPAGNNELKRTGEAATIPYNYNLVQNPNGTQIISPNCLQCHAQVINNQFLVGLGNSFFDFTSGHLYGAPDGVTDTALQFLAQAIKGRNQTEYEAFEPFFKSVIASNPYLNTDVVGVNSAQKLATVLGIFRDKTTLMWKDIPSTSKINYEVYPTDVPPWWTFKKKNAVYYATWGRGSLSRHLLLASMLTLKDSAEARKIDNNFADVMAYLKTITPPKYPNTIDPTLAYQGLKVFTYKCSGCHGTYEVNNITYPNYLVSVDLVGTDAYLIKDNFYKAQYIAWFNEGWLGKVGPNVGHFEDSNGYIAPPLDGIWATAPYLHNGSVPTLDDLLNSSQRPKYFKRSFRNDDYNYTKVGWNYSVESTKTDKYTYDTTKPGYGNQGHLFGDGLSAAERKALIEYLKTL